MASLLAHLPSSLTAHLKACPNQLDPVDPKCPSYGEAPTIAHLPVYSNVVENEEIRAIMINSGYGIFKTCAETY